MDNIVRIAKQISPAVVSIAATKDLPRIEGFYPLPMGEKNFIIPQFRKNEKKSIKLGGGSGFVVNRRGIILTNSHVVEDPKAEYTAIFGDNSKHRISVLARDPIHDIAICKIEGENHPFLPLGDSTQIELGEHVVAVGNALGEFANTISLGIVSGLSRYIRAQNSHRKTEHLRNLIQTDAAINPGNSGGPLINMHGKVIGINTAVIYEAQSIGFSIPINQAREDIDQVKTHGRILIPFLGIQYFIINKETAEKNELPASHGALITRKSLGSVAVIPGSSAQKAGLKEFDIILKADDQTISDSFTLQDALQGHKIGDSLLLTVLRNRKERLIPVTLEEKKH